MTRNIFSTKVSIVSIALVMGCPAAFSQVTSVVADKPATSVPPRILNETPSGNTILITGEDPHPQDPMPIVSDDEIVLGAPEGYAVTYDTQTGEEIRFCDDGDVDGSGGVDLADAILVLQVLAGMELSPTICDHAVISQDPEIGLEEGVYIIQTLCQFRSAQGESLSKAALGSFVPGGMGVRSLPRGPCPVDPIKLLSFGSLSRVWPDHDLETFPWSGIVRLFFHFPDDEWVDSNGDGDPDYREGHMCSGCLIDPMHVLTAGHCIHEGDGGDWAEFMTVTPAFDTHDEVQQVWNDASGGTFMLTFDGETTGTIPFDAAAIQVESVLEGLPNIENVGVSGSGHLSDPWIITFHDPGRRDVAELTADDTQLSIGATSITTVHNGGSVAPFGNANAAGFLSWEGWTDHGYYIHDVGVVRLNRPIGALSGWFGYGYNDDCDFFRNGAFRHAGYPGEGFSDTTIMYTRTGDYPICVWEYNLLKYWTKSYGGQSGSPSFSDTDGHTTWAVISSVWNTPPVFTRDGRLTNGKFDHIGDFVEEHMPAGLDLIPLDCQVTPSEIVAGETVSSLSFVIHNYSSNAWSGSVEAYYYLSNDDVIASDDTHLFSSDGVYGGVAASGDFCARCSVVVTVSPAYLPRVPLDTSAGDYWLGMILQEVDENPSNNAMRGQDTARIIVQAAPTPAAPTSLVATAFSYNQINLSWTDNADNEDGFRIERSLYGTGVWDEIDWVGADTTLYMDFPVDSDTTYCYRVRACNAVTGCALSNTDCETTPTPPPEAPADLAATDAWPPGEASPSVELTWTDNSDNEDGFEIWRRIGFDGDFTLLHTLNQADKTAYEDTDLAAETTYCYKVRAYNVTDASDFTASDCATTRWGPEPTSGPEAPDFLTANAVGVAIELTWIDHSDIEEGFRVERREEEDPFSPIAVVGRNVTAYTDAGPQSQGLDAGTTYCYRVRAWNWVGDSDYSNEACAEAYLAIDPPTDFSAAAADPGEIDLNWSDESDNEDGFEIERALPGGPFSVIGSAGEDEEAFSDSGLTPGTQYCYRVRAYRLAGVVAPKKEYSAYTATECAVAP